MALAKRNAVDDTLALVRDVDKFKDRIEQLAKAERSATKAQKKSADKCKALAIEMDDMRAAAQREVNDARARAKSAIRSISQEKDAVMEEQGKVDRKLKALGKREDKLAQEKAILDSQKVMLDDAVKSFDVKVAAYNDAVASASRVAVG